MVRDNKIFVFMLYPALVLLILFVISGCTMSQVDRLSKLGKEPELKSIENPVEKVQPVSWPRLPNGKRHFRTVNSLWSPSSKEFFRDQRAYRIGDILIVKVEISDKAELDNKSERKRTGTDSLTAPSIFGTEQNLFQAIPLGKANPSSLLNINSNMDNSGEGLIEREEVIETEIAAVVTQVLPNGNLVIYGSQEVRVNFEVRQLVVEGVIRTEDISPDNVIKSNQIAEARISYGGKGLISDVQQPRIGSQIVDVLSPW